MTHVVGGVNDADDILSIHILSIAMWGNTIWRNLPHPFITLVSEEREIGVN